VHTWFCALQVARFKQPILDRCSAQNSNLWFQRGRMVLPGVGEELQPVLLVHRRRAHLTEWDCFQMHTPDPEGGGSEVQHAQQARMPALLRGAFLCLMGAEQAAAAGADVAEVADSCTMLLEFNSLEGQGKGEPVLKVQLTWRADNVDDPEAVAVASG